jgi:hypothetical protein
METKPFSHDGDINANDKMFMNIIENAILIIDINASTVPIGVQDADMMLASIARTLAAFLPIFNNINTNNNNFIVENQSAYHNVCNVATSASRIWDRLYSVSSSIQVRHECLLCLKHFIPSSDVRTSPFSASVLTHSKFASICKDVLNNRNDYTLQSLYCAIEIISLIILIDSNSIFEVINMTLICTHCILCLRIYINLNLLWR